MTISVLYDWNLFCLIFMTISWKLSSEIQRGFEERRSWLCQYLEKILWNEGPRSPINGCVEAEIVASTKRNSLPEELKKLRERKNTIPEAEISLKAVCLEEKRIWNMKAHLSTRNTKHRYAKLRFSKALWKHKPRARESAKYQRNGWHSRDIVNDNQCEKYLKKSLWYSMSEKILAVVMWLYYLNQWNEMKINENMRRRWKRKHQCLKTMKKARNREKTEENISVKRRNIRCLEMKINGNVENEAEGGKWRNTGGGRKWRQRIATSSALHAHLTKYMAKTVYINEEEEESIEWREKRKYSD